MRNTPSYLHEIYNVSGTPYEIGLQRGKLTAKYLRESLDDLTLGNPYYKSQLKPDQYNLDYLKENYPNQFKKWETALARTPEWLREEAKGLAEGAGVPLEKVLIMGEVFPFFLRNDIEGSKVTLDDDCNGFIAYGNATVGGRALVGGNSEGPQARIRDLSVIRVKNKVGNSFVMQSHLDSGLGVGQAGMNEKGVCIFGSGVSIKHEFWGDVGYRHMVRRRVLQDADNLDEAIDVVKEGPLMGGQHLYVADTKRAVHIEYTGKNVEVIDPKSGFDAGASPYFSTPKTQEWCNVISDNTDPKYTYSVAKARGLFRMERYHELFQMHKPLTIEKIPLLLGDHGGRGTGIIQEHIKGACPQGSDYTICVHGQPQSGSFHSAYWSVINVPDERKMYMAFGNPCEAGYVPFTVPT